MLKTQRILNLHLVFCFPLSIQKCLNVITSPICIIETSFFLPGCSGTLVPLLILFSYTRKIFLRKWYRYILKKIPSYQYRPEIIRRTYSAVQWLIKSTADQVTVDNEWQGIVKKILCRPKQSPQLSMVICRLS